MKRKYAAAVLALIFLCGVALRLYHLTSVPRGLHRDEMSEFYEAYCLFKTGADRWGFRWPVYFLSWGSGQNVLQAYLSIPVAAVTGLTAVGVRFIPALFGVMMLPLFYLAMRRWYGRGPAFVGLILLAFSPWHIMLSRWGIENNQLPFLILLGLFLVRLALDRQSALLILCSLLPFALAMYSYGVFVSMLPTLAVLLIIAFHAELRQRWKLWLGAVAIFAIVSAPINFFVYKNYIAKRDFAFERHLPITVPYIPITRLAQAKKEIGKENLYEHNLRFTLKQFRDPKEAWYNVQPLPPLPKIVLLLSAIGICHQIVTFLRTRRYRDCFGLWLLACVPLFVLFPLNVSRAIGLFTPLIAIAATEFCALWAMLRSQRWRLSLGATCGVSFLISVAFFVPRYFGDSYAEMIGRDFHPEMPQALEALNRLSAERTPMYVTNKLWLPYVDVLYYRRIPPVEFQSSGATWSNPDFGRYRFNYREDFESAAPFAFLLLDGEGPVCNKPSNVEVIGRFVVGACDLPGSHSLPQSPGLIPSRN